MDTTASSFTLRKNAKRAAEAMIRNGTAPAVDYDINPSRGRPARIVLGDPMPEMMKLLPEPGELGA